MGRKDDVMKIACDSCDAIGEQPVCNWLHVEPIDVDARSFGDRPPAGRFCSKRCLVNYYSPAVGALADALERDGWKQR